MKSKNLRRFLVGGFFLLTTQFAQANCDEKTTQMLLAQGATRVSLGRCTYEKVSGLQRMEELVKYVPYSPDDAVLYFIRRGEDYAPTPVVDYKTVKNSELAARIAKAKLSEMTKGQAQNIYVDCPIVKESDIHLSLKNDYGRGVWSVYVLSPISCRAKYETKNPYTVSLSNVELFPGQAEYNADLTLNVSTYGMKNDVRQTFVRLPGGANDVHYNENVARFFFPRCKNKNVAQPKAEPSVPYNWNQFPGKSKHDAIAVNMGGKTPIEAISGTHDKAQATLLLERKTANGRGEIYGVWKVSSAQELDNLIANDLKDDEFRILYRDLDCGRDVATNWIKF